MTVVCLPARDPFICQGTQQPRITKYQLDGQRKGFADFVYAHSRKDGMVLKDPPLQSVHMQRARAPGHRLRTGTR